MDKLRVLDLCCGLGGWAKPWKEYGHYYVGIDICEPADIIADVRDLPLINDQWDVILASPPCTEFTIKSMPWYVGYPDPDMSIVQACFEYDRVSNPRYFILENVKGAQRYIGKCQYIAGSRFLWGRFPLPDMEIGPDLFGKWKMAPSLDRARIRAKIPDRLAYAVYHSITGEIMAAPTAPVKPVATDKPTRKPRAKAPENESKADKFRRLANHRVPRLLKLFKAIGALGNKAQYEATDEQIAKILQAVQESYASMKERLYGSQKEVSNFRL